MSGRTRRTRERLGDAIIALLQERELDAITVQDVLDRAGVSRSTFYTHYRDKDDLLLSDLNEFLESAATALAHGGDALNRVAPVRELFAACRRRPADLDRPRGGRTAPGFSRACAGTLRSCHRGTSCREVLRGVHALVWTGATE